MACRQPALIVTPPMLHTEWIQDMWRHQRSVSMTPLTLALLTAAIPAGFCTSALAQNTPHAPAGEIRSTAGSGGAASQKTTGAHGPSQLAALTQPLPSVIGAAAAETRIALNAPMLTITRPPEVALREIDIVITPQHVRGRYVLHNQSDRDIGALVAFPAPDLDGASPQIGYMAVPEPEQMNFMGFSATVDGRAVTPMEEVHAFGAGLDRTPLLEQFHTSPQPVSGAASQALGKLGPQALQDLGAAGMIDIDRIGARSEARPRWLLKATWYWPQVFPAGKQTVIEWRHRASVAGRTTPVSAIRDTDFALLQARHCAQNTVRDAVTAAQKNGPGNDWLLARSVRQRLATGPAYAGPAAVVTVTIDAGADGGLVASCLPGLAQVSANMWRARYENVVVDEQVDVMFVSPGKGASQAVPPSEDDSFPPAPGQGN